MLFLIQSSIRSAEEAADQKAAMEAVMNELRSYFTPAALEETCNAHTEEYELYNLRRQGVFIHEPHKLKCR